MASDSKKTTTADKTDVGQAEVQAKFDDANEKGYFGTTPEEKPNEDFTLAGVTKNTK